MRNVHDALLYLENAGCYQKNNGGFTRSRFIQGGILFYKKRPALRDKITY